MTQGLQYYGGSGAPMRVPSAPADVVTAWRAHRLRLRRWFDGLDESDWSRATRCSEWNVTDMAQHLISGAQFLGFTLHQALKGEATTFLAGFDAQRTAAEATAQLDGMRPSALVAELSAVDARVDAELCRIEAVGWDLTAEAPPGHVPAHVAVNHFLFDSWVHERDLDLGVAEAASSVDETAVVLTYALALAGVARAIDDRRPREQSLHLDLVDIGRRVTVQLTAAGSTVTYGSDTARPAVQVSAASVVDYATGRTGPTQFVADKATTSYLGHLAHLMA